MRFGRWRSVWHAFNEDDDIFIFFKYLSCQSIKSIQAHACTTQRADKPKTNQQTNKMTSVYALWHSFVFISIENPIFLLGVRSKTIVQRTPQNTRTQIIIYWKSHEKNKSHNCISIRVDRKRIAATNFTKWIKWLSFGKIQGQLSIFGVNWKALIWKFDGIKVQYIRKATLTQNIILEFRLHISIELEIKTTLYNSNSMILHTRKLTFSQIFFEN